MTKYSFLHLLLWFLELPVRLVMKMKKVMVVRGLRKAGRNFAFSPFDSVFSSSRVIQIGDNVFVGRNAYFGGEIYIANNVMFGPNVTLLAGNHIFAVRGKSPRFITPLTGQNSEPIVIEDEVWVGANVVVLGNVRIGIGAVVGAGSVVVDDVCPFTVAIGNPCHSVRRIFDDENLLIHLQEIGYDDTFAADVVKRRNAFLKNVNISVIDKTNDYARCLYKPF